MTSTTTPSPATRGIRTLLRDAGAGRVAYRWLHRPMERTRTKFVLGWRPGLAAVFGEFQMKAAARRLPARASAVAGAPTLACAFLTGNRYWHQTAFCAYSLGSYWDGRLELDIFDDGTLRPAQAALLRRLFPDARIVPSAESCARAAALLPRERFPRLHELREQVPMTRKLIDVRLAASGWQTYLDSDMLFFRRPDALLDCVARQQPFCLQDAVYGYCAPLDRVREVCGVQTPAHLNAGITALDNRQIDWERVERWCATFSTAERSHVLLEQTLSASLLARAGARTLPSADYRMLYGWIDGETSTGAVLGHYVHQAKIGYVAHEWRRCLPAQPAT